MNKKDKEAYAQRLAQLEKEGNFDVFTIESNLTNLTPVDKDYVFLPSGLGEKTLRVAEMAVLETFGRLANFLLFDIRVRGTDKLKDVKGAVTISNHVLFLDTLVIKQTFGFERTYMTGASHNCKSGFFGSFLKSGGFLALNGTFEATKNFYKAVKELLDAGKFVHFNPEQSMWVGYEKPRPFKKGAFSTAAKFSVPVVPMFIMFRKSSWRDKLNWQPAVTVKILDPIFPKAELSVKENADFMLAEAEREYKDEYEKFYRKPLVYACDDLVSSAPADGQNAN